MLDRQQEEYVTTRESFQGVDEQICFEFNVELRMLFAKISLELVNADAARFVQRSHSLDY